MSRWIHRLLTAIVQIIYWIIGVIAHSQNFQRYFQANTVKDRKVFSYFYLGQLMFEYGKVNELDLQYGQLPHVIATELARSW